MKYAEFHSHTYYSNTGSKYGIECLTSPEQLLSHARDIGLSAIAITDHNTMEGNLEAQKLSEKYGIVVIPAEEFDTDKMGQVLGYGISAGISPFRNPIEIINDIHECGGVAIIPHPFDIICGMEDLEQVSKHADGIEIYNAGATKNRKAQAFAERQGILLTTVGSDAHSSRLVGHARLAFDDRCETPEDYIYALKEGKFDQVRTKPWMYSITLGGINAVHSRFAGILHKDRYLIN